MKTKRYECNGYLLGIDREFSAVFKTRILVLAEEMRQEAQLALSVRNDVVFGARFQSNDMILSRVLSGMVNSRKAFMDPITQDLLFDIEAEETDEDMRLWVLDAFRDCATSDHWYLYEKNWE